MQHLRQWVGDELAKVAETVRGGSAMDMGRLDELTLTLLVTELSAEIQKEYPDRFGLENLVKTMGGFRSAKKPGTKGGGDSLSEKEAEEFAKKLREGA